MMSCQKLFAFRSSKVPSWQTLLRFGTVPQPPPEKKDNEKMMRQKKECPFQKHLPFTAIYLTLRPVLALSGLFALSIK